MKKVLTCILNDKAGTGAAVEAGRLMARTANEQGWDARVVIYRGGGELKALAEEARGAGGMVVGGGGDGTMAAIAAALVDTDAVLGVLPMGTLNHFAKEIGIPMELESAVTTLFNGRIARVDVGEVNGRIFLNNSSLGFYPRIVEERDREQRRGRGKWLAFALAAADIFQRSRTLHLDLETTDGGHQSRDTTFAFVGNNRYTLSGLQIGSRAAMDGGKLWVFVAPDVGRFTLLWLALQAALGFVHDANLAAFETGQVEVRMRRDQVHVATDGEVNVMPTPLRYRSRPGALRVIVPVAD